MKLSKEAEKDIAQLQLLEQNLQMFLTQRQNFQMQQLEIENALKEIELTKEAPFKIIGNVMVATSKDALKKELESKKEILAVRIKNIESQEEKIRGRVETLQKSVVQELQKEEGKK